MFDDKAEKKSAYDQRKTAHVQVRFFFREISIEKKGKLKGKGTKSTGTFRQREGRAHDTVT